MCVCVYIVYSPPPINGLKNPRAHGEHVRAASPAGSLPAPHVQVGLT